MNVDRDVEEHIADGLPLGPAEARVVAGWWHGVEVQDAFAFLEHAQHAEGYRVAALRARWAAGRFENAATLLSHAEDADQADHNARTVTNRT